MRGWQNLPPLPGCGLNRAPLVYLAEGRGADSAPPHPCLPRESVAVARWARRQTKALDESFFKKILEIFLKGHMSGQRQVKRQNRHLLIKAQGQVQIK